MAYRAIFLNCSLEQVQYLYLYSVSPSASVPGVSYAYNVLGARSRLRSVLGMVLGPVAVAYGDMERVRNLFCHLYLGGLACHTVPP